MAKTYKNLHVMKGRAMLLFIIFLFSLVFLSWKLVQINFIDNRNYEQRVRAQQISNLTETVSQVVPKRGAILDARGIALAESNMVYHLIFDPAVLLDLKALEAERGSEADIQGTTVQFLADHLDGVTVERLNKLLVERKSSHYEVIARSLTYLEYLPIMEAKMAGTIGGVYFEEQYKREYPFNNMASDLIGFLQGDGVGLWGLERFYDEALSGSLGRRFGAVDGDNSVRQEDVNARDGYDITLNVDFTVQTYIEEAIENFYEEEEALGVEVVIMDPRNGQVLGMASYPNYDLNKPYDVSHLLTEEEIEAMTDEEVGLFRERLWKNGAVTDSYEPGSTFKPFTVAMALEEYKVTEESTFYCPGYKIPFEGLAPIHCHKRSGHGEQTLMEALSNSCNVAMMDISLALGRDFFYDYQRMFGFGAVTFADLQGEVSSRNNVYTRQQLNPVELQTSSFGQGFNVTPIQLITGFSSLINGGYLYEPQVMNRVTDQKGQLIYQSEPVLQRKVISREVSDQMLAALRQVVDSGTGKRSQIEGYSVGGKTGTAEKGNRAIKNYVVSFIGFSPTDSPEVICLVVVDEPVLPAGEGANSRYAAAIFKDIMEDVLPYLQVPKVYGETEADIESKTD